MTLHQVWFDLEAGLAIVLVLGLSLTLVWLCGVAVTGTFTLIRSAWRRKHGQEPPLVPDPPLTPAQRRRIQRTLCVWGVICLGFGLWELAHHPGQWREAVYLLSGSLQAFGWAWIGRPQSRKTTGISEEEGEHTVRPS